MNVIIRRADRQDFPQLRKFLTRAGLGTEGISEGSIECFLLLETEDRTCKGTLGIEYFQKSGLLRSFVISPGQAENDIFLLFEKAIALARAKRIQNLFLATNKSMAVPFFKILGFQMIDKNKLSEELLVSSHIKSISNVNNSLFLKLAL